jgi:pimeloyl-ACP methyl ester carboxylesterase
MKLSSAKSSSPSALAWLSSAVALAAVTAAWVERRARRAERQNRPEGRLLEVDGVRLHCVERGAGPPVVLVHGNMVWHRDFEASGLLDRLARNHRVIAFDRPGFGHSTRPRDRLWTPTAQADLLHRALAMLGVRRPVVVGHSMGAMVAMAMALDHPADVRKLVLIGGYFYPSLRVDALLTAPVALPVIGDVMRYTVTALQARLMLDKLVRTMFSPRDVPRRFLPTLSREMMLRPVQLRANAEDAAFMVPQARSNSQRHAELRMPVAIVAGAEDAVIDPQAHSVRLQRDLSQSTLAVLPAAGHMVHYAALDAIVALIEDGIGEERATAENVSQSAEMPALATPS